ncbi:DUF1648 domain-containing protein [Bacillus xiapuensis]|uniref:DUF1648 domain-containing protein n=1 Tax=Bacillus xiapuensis TaxID=2014075 RepID=UPI000C24E790|nr:DUF1648 domain-containing protein [Bacillus xiapuensis]
MSNYWQRPEIKIPKTKSEWIWDIIGFFFFFASILFLFIVWGNLPEKVPAHYGFSGEVNRWGSKWELLILPGTGVFLLLLMTAMERHPEMHNYPRRFNESNAEAFYRHSRKIVNQLKNICLLLFAFIQVTTILIALGYKINLNQWFLPVIIVSTGWPIVIGLIKQKKIK